MILWRTDGNQGINTSIMYFCEKFYEYGDVHVMVFEFPILSLVVLSTFH